MRRRSPAQWFSLIGGAILLIRGSLGVLLDPAFESPGEGWHQLIHLSSGAVLLASAKRANWALATARGFGLFYAAVAVVGVVDGQDVANVIPVQGGDNLLHTVLTVASLGAGLLSLRKGSAPLRAA
jgi:hypothetical protein